MRHRWEGKLLSTVQNALHVPAQVTFTPTCEGIVLSLQMVQNQSQCLVTCCGHTARKWQGRRAVAPENLMCL